MKNLIVISLSLVGLSVLSGCTGQNLSKDQPGQPANNPINLERDFQEVIHYDCNNNIVSDSIETVASPIQWVTINPQDPSNIGNSVYTNTTTNSSAGYISNYGFYVDYSYGFFNMHVVSGINVISYTFYNCDARNADGSCAAAKTVNETGTSTINVSYTEKTISGVMKVNDCAPPSPSPTPAH